MDRTTHCPDCFQPPAPDPVCRCGFDPRRAYDDSSLLPPFTALGGGRYLTGRVLGEPGGFGVVYAGLQTGLVPMPVAIKEFFPQSVNPLAGRARNGIDVSARPGREGEYARWRGRFLDEARLLASLHQPRIQPRIVHVRDLFEDHGTAYLVMERLCGHNLAEHLGSWTHTAEQGSTLPRRLPPGDAWALLLAALEGLEALHGRPGGPVIHRDLTPNNLFLEGGRIDCVKLLDFGLAREGERTVAASSAGVGNPAFMPPEQAQDRTNPGERVAASDCYTLAASLYCALTGRPPPSPEARRGGFGLAELRRLPGLDPTLARVLTECLALDWRARPANAKALRQRLAAATVDLGSPPGPEPEPDPPPDPRPLKPGPGPKPKTGRKPAGGRDAKPRSKPKPADPRRRAARWLAPVLILAALTVGAGWWIFGPGWPTGRASSSGAAPAPVVAPAITVPKPPSPEPPVPEPVAPSAAAPAAETYGQPPITPDNGTAPGRFVKLDLLAACWPQGLEGTAKERKIERLKPADHSLPERLAPLSPSLPLAAGLARSLRSVAPAQGEKLVALTFDLCEQANERSGYDSALVDTLRRNRVKATFYAGGKWMRSHPERTMQIMADPLFELGNHAWTHGNLRVLKGAEMQDQIRWTQVQYELLREELLAKPCASRVAAEAKQLIPRLPKTFRFPYGTCNAESLQAVAESGLYPVQWSIVTGDSAKGQTAERIVKTVLDALRPGSIVVAYGNGRGWHATQALQTLIPEILQRGYRFVTVSELIDSGDPVAADTCYEQKPGDNLRYDKLFGKGTE